MSRPAEPDNLLRQSGDHMVIRVHATRPAQSIA